MIRQVMPRGGGILSAWRDGSHATWPFDVRQLNVERTWLTRNAEVRVSIKACPFAELLYVYIEWLTELPLDFRSSGKSIMQLRTSHLGSTRSYTRPRISGISDRQKRQTGFFVHCLTH
ncbi:hypothetical protein [Burkholderia sp. MSMB0856]|uniref:hypothetical protein n=1 Tax=Burkholderia sp. MSMB0856 TaxID=1637869 RepID=UPI00131EF6A9|nr:hypothetical protein [Burkholderia sp. MSMB0856]